MTSRAFRAGTSLRHVDQPSLGAASEIRSAPPVPACPQSSGARAAANTTCSVVSTALPPDLGGASLSLRCSGPSGGPCPVFWTAETSTHMTQPPRKPDHTLAPRAACGVDQVSALRAGRLAKGPAQVRTHAVGQVVVLEVAGPLSDVIEELDRAIQLALADGPRGVVCDLSDVPEGAARAELARDPRGHGQPRPPGSHWLQRVRFGKVLSAAGRSGARRRGQREANARPTAAGAGTQTGRRPLLGIASVSSGTAACVLVGTMGTPWGRVFRSGNRSRDDSGPSTTCRKWSSEVSQADGSTDAPDCLGPRHVAVMAAVKPGGVVSAFACDQGTTVSSDRPVEG